MSITKRIQDTVDKLRNFQNDVDDGTNTTAEILVSISDFIDDDLHDLINELDEIADEAEKLEDQVEELEEELEDLKGGE